MIDDGGLRWVIAAVALAAVVQAGADLRRLPRYQGYLASGKPYGATVAD